MSATCPICASIAVLLTAGVGHSSEVAAFPVGVWLLNQTESKTLTKKVQALHVLRDDGNTLAFTIVESVPGRPPRTISWSGDYGGAPRPVDGANETLRVDHRDGVITLTGSEIGGGRFAERCWIAPDKMRLGCDGLHWDANGRQTDYREVYDRK